MFIFITPKIIKDSREEFEELKRIELEKRAGDTPEFLKRVKEAKDEEAHRYFKCNIQDYLTGGRR